MNYSELKTRAAYLSQIDGWDKVAPAPDWSDLVNRGYLDFAWDTEFNWEEDTFVTVANQAEYTIDSSNPPRYFKYIKEAAYNTDGSPGMILRKTTELDERRRDPLWFTRTMATPNRFLIPKPNTIRLIEKPDTSDVQVTIRGPRSPVLLSAATDLPAIPDTFHEFIAIRACVIHAEVYARDEISIAKLNDLRQQYTGGVKDCKGYLSSDRYSQLVRRVRRERPRIFLDGLGRWY